MAEKQEPAIESMSFEEALNELQSLVKALEKGEAKLEEAIRAYERGAALKQHCERKLREAQAKVDKIVIGGGMAFTFLKALGYNVGKSLVEEDLLETARKTYDQAREKGIKFYLPVDCVAADRFNPEAETKVTPIQEIPDEWMGLDIGPATVTLFTEALQNAKTIIWNGPMGVFEMDPFSRGTFAMVTAVANSYALTIVGGGDTDSAVHRAGEYAKISYISTGGGAFLELLEGKKLPGIQVLESYGHK